MIQDLSGCSIIGDTTSIITETAPGLLSLIGSPPYLPLQLDSPAVDAGDPTGCTDGQGNLLNVDQRGAGRIGRCDIGAYEYTVPGLAANVITYSGTPQTTGVANPFSKPLQLLVLDNIGSPVSGTVVSFSAPITGASGIFRDGGTFTVTARTGESGFTPPLVFVANATPGTYIVSATVDSVITPTDFLLTNLAQVFLPVVAKPDPAAIVDEFPFTDRCTQFPVKYNGQDKARVTMCVTSVQIRLDSQMKFNMRWTVEFLANDIDWVHKGSDVGNPNMNATDNLGNRYDHVALGGAALNGAYFYRIGGPTSATGWYLFPPARSGATVFTFHDDDQHVAIGDIMLVR